MKNTKLAAVLDQATALMRSELPPGEATGPFAWLATALSHLDGASHTYGLYEAATEHERDRVQQQAEVTRQQRIIRERAVEHARTLAAQAELRRTQQQTAQGAPRPTEGDRA